MSSDSTQVMVAFSEKEGRTTGDSSLNAHECIPHIDGESFEDARDRYYTLMCEGWGMDRAELFEDILGGDENFVTGFWILDEETHDIITGVSVKCGNDSAAYTVHHLMKEQIARASNDELTPA